MHKLQDWGTNHTEQIFWLSGMAGTGKSTIARTLAEILDKEKALGGTFFFSRSSGEANHAARFIGTLAYHLAHTSTLLKLLVCEAISSNANVTQQGLRNQWKELIITPLTKAKFSSGQPKLNLVIDALDECGSEDDIRLLIQLFVELKSVATVDMGVFVTGRPKIVIRLGFKNVPRIFHQNLDLRDIPREDVERDILLFVRQELGRVFEERELGDRPSEKDLQILAKKAGCLFIYAATACRYIRDTSWNPAERFNELVQGGSSDVIESTQLDGIYTQVLERSLITGRHANDAKKLCDRFRDIVGSIVILYDELSVYSLSQLLSWSVQSVSACLGSLHSVLSVPNNFESPVPLIHPSFRDYILNRPRCGGEDVFDDEARAHRRLFSTCMRTMSVSLTRNICVLPTPGSSALEARADILNRRMPRHLQYACYHWMSHLAGAGPEVIEPELDNNSHIHEFLQQKFLHWLEAMSILGAMAQAVSMIIELANMVKVCNSIISLVPICTNSPHARVLKVVHYLRSLTTREDSF